MRHILLDCHGGHWQDGRSGVSGSHHSWCSQGSLMPFPGRRPGCRQRTSSISVHGQRRSQQVLDVKVTNIRPGDYIALDRGIWEVTNYEHVKPGKGGAFVRIKIKNLQTGAALERTIDGDGSVQQVETTDHQASFLYKKGDICTFMNLNTNEQVELPTWL